MKFVKVSIVEAEPTNYQTFKIKKEGYKVKTYNGNNSFYSKEEFESNHIHILEINDGNFMIDRKDIEKLIKHIYTDIYIANGIYKLLIEFEFKNKFSLCNSFCIDEDYESLKSRGLSIQEIKNYYINMLKPDIDDWINSELNKLISFMMSLTC